MELFMKKALVCGGAGFVGSAVVRELLDRNVETWVVVREGFVDRNHRLEGLPVHLVECNLDEIAKIPERISERDIDVWYQFAWDGLFYEPLLDYKRQIANIQYVMDAIISAKAIGCKKFVGSGSITQYELTVPEGRNAVGDKHKIYKTAKLACEYMGEAVAQQQEIDFIWPIFTNIFGVGETSNRLINSMIRNLQAGKHQSLSEGNQIYDFIYITDAAKALYLIGEKGRAGGHYVLAGGDAKPLKEFLETLRNVVDPSAELGFGEMSFNGIYLPAEMYSIKELTADTGFVPEVPFDEAVRLTADWIKEQ